MTDIRIEKVNEELHPFQEDINVSNFFPGGQRSEVLEEIIGAVYREIPIVILTGEEGSGKTMLCRVLEERLANGFGVVIFPTPSNHSMMWSARSPCVSEWRWTASRIGKTRKNICSRLSTT